MSFIAGAYTATWNSVDVGRTERGWNVEQDYHQEAVIADSYGDMWVDGVQQGVDTIVTCDFIEYDLLATAIYAQQGGAGLGNNKVGILLTSLAHPLVLTPVSGTTAASNGKTWTFPLAIITDNVSILLSSKLRKGPLRWRCFPNLSSGVVYTQS